MPKKRPRSASPKRPPKKVSSGRQALAAQAGAMGDRANFLAAVGSAGELWNNARDQRKAPPDGPYIAKLLPARYTAKDGNAMVILNFVVCAGEERGKQLTIFHRLFRKDATDSQGMFFLQRDFETLGFDMEDMAPENIPDILDTLNTELADKETDDVCCRVTAKTTVGKGDDEREFTNIYLNGLCDPPDGI